ncbi:MAG: S-layer homology domain-containing protein [Oscillospiraceae bacterium]|nr:S-layer homology domain-containing protein [Oscillospiraceae bacterium]
MRISMFHRHHTSHGGLRLALRRGTAALLSTLLLSGAASATAGSRQDPFLTRSYIQENVLPQFRARCAEAAAARMLELRQQRRGLRLLTLSAPQSLSLHPGEQITVLQGTIRLKAVNGELIDVTEGAVFRDGVGWGAHRYVLAGDSAWGDVPQWAVILVSATAALGEGSPFEDVRESDWFFSDVVQAFRRGLVNGMDANRYAPGGTLTLAQCVKLAACMRQLKAEGAVSLRNGANGAPWYRSYADYALETGILTEEPEDYDATVDRRGFVELFSRAMPMDGEAVNTIPAGAIPDVAADDPGAAAIYAFYRAGILAGYTADGVHAAHAFDPESTVSRAEVAAILNRMFDPEARVRFDMEPPVEQTQPPVAETEPPVEETEAPVEESEAPVDETEPPVVESTPPVDATEPPMEESEAPVDETEPPVEGASDAV